MFSKQKISEFRDRPGKNLARVLAENSQSNIILHMQQQDNTLTDEPEGKLQVFYDYYKNLYRSESVAEKELDVLL